MRLHEAAPDYVSETIAFRDAAPVVTYEIDGIDRLVRVNDAWSSFATANGGLHLVAGRVIGRSLWDFVSGETTRQVYKSLLRRVRDNGRSRFIYRCDAPERQRLMEMTITGGLGGHVRFDSRTLLVECGPKPQRRRVASPPRRPLCHCCGRAQDAGPDPHSRTPAFLVHAGSVPAADPPHEMCGACVNVMMRSVAYDAPLAAGAGTALAV